MRNKAAFAMFLALSLAFIRPAGAAEPAPGDACTTAGQVVGTGGPEQIPARELVCDGVQWNEVRATTTAGKSLLQFDNDTGACTIAKAGRLRYSGGTTPWYYCDGSAWNPFESAGIAPAYTTFTAAKIFAMSSTSVALKSDGSYYGWGYNGNYQLGDGTTTSRIIPTVPLPAFAGPWQTVGMGTSNVCGIKTDGTLWCWGDNSTGQIGDGTTTTRNTPAQISGGGTWTQVAGGGTTTPGYTSVFFTCGVKSDATGWCWGGNGNGQLGDGTTTERHIPVQVPGSWTMIVPSKSTGWHTCGIKTDGTLWCWGHNANGQLGDGTTTQRTSPVQVGTDTWSQVVAGGDKACGIKTDGTLWCWGLDSSGQLGNGPSGSSSSPVQVSGGGTDWSYVTAGSVHTCALKTGGTAWCWGNNASGETGTGAIGSVTVPTQVMLATSYTGSAWIDIAASSSYTCAIRDDSTVYCWGSNTNGRSGDPYFGRIIGVGAP